MLFFVDGADLSSSTDATSFLFQLRTVVERNTTALWRSPDYTFTRLFVTNFLSFFISLSFLQLGNSVRDLQFRVFGMFVFRLAFSVISLTGPSLSRFWVVVLPALVMSQIELLFIYNQSKLSAHSN